MRKWLMLLLKEFNLINWDDMKKKGSQNRFSEIGEITINNNKIKIFAMPFSNK